MECYTWFYSFSSYKVDIFSYHCIYVILFKERIIFKYNRLWYMYVITALLINHLDWFPFFTLTNTAKTDIILQQSLWTHGSF